MMQKLGSPEGAWATKNPLSLHHFCHLASYEAGSNRLSIKSFSSPGYNRRTSTNTVRCAPALSGGIRSRCQRKIEDVVGS